MTGVPSGTESARPFVPATNIDLSKRFYVKLGFEKVLDGDVAAFRIGSSGFILAAFDQAENFIMQLMVDDLVYSGMWPSDGQGHRRIYDPKISHLRLAPTQ
jgi:hypothetical protein